MSKSGKITGGVASSERRAARKAFWLFLAVAILCTAQVGWWLIIHMRDAQALAELKQAELRSEAYLLDEMLRSHYIGLWYTLDSAIHREDWDGTLPRSVKVNPAYKGSGNRPPVSRRSESYFGTIDVKQWTWAFPDVVPLLFVELDFTYPERIISRNSTNLRFAGHAPSPGLSPWSAKWRAVEIDPIALDEIDAEYQRVFVMFASESAFFVILIVMGVYLMYRSVRQSSDLRRQQQNFIAAVTHELKTPVSSVKLYAETMERTEISRPDQEKYLRRMQEDITRLEQLIDDILQVGRLEQKSSRLNLKPTDFSRDVTEYVDTMQGYLERNNFTLHTNIEPGLLAVTEYDAMRRVVACLVENSVKYSDSRHEAELTLRSDNGQIELSLKDYGVGVPAEEIEKVFQAFYRVGDEMTRKIGGTGLGLYLVREIVASHGGSVELRSEGTGQGTTVTIRLQKGQKS